MVPELSPTLNVKRTNVDAEIIIAIRAVFISIGLVLDAVCKQHDWQRFPSGMICVKCKRSPVADYIAKFDPDFD
jgi:hypothetical protein